MLLFQALLLVDDGEGQLFEDVLVPVDARVDFDESKSVRGQTEDAALRDVQDFLAVLDGSLRGEADAADLVDELRDGTFLLDGDVAFVVVDFQQMSRPPLS